MFISFFCLNNAQYVIYGNSTNKQWIELNYTELWQEPGYDLQTTDEACDLAPESTI